MQIRRHPKIEGTGGKDDAGRIVQATIALSVESPFVTGARITASWDRCRPATNSNNEKD